MLISIEDVKSFKLDVGHVRRVARAKTLHQQFYIEFFNIKTTCSFLSILAVFIFAAHRNILFSSRLVSHATYVCNISRIFFSRCRETEFISV